MIEAELHQKKLKKILDLNDNLFVTYDTGNMTSFGINHKEYIAAAKHKINNVHLKDRTYDAVTVSPGSGDTNFALVFKELAKIDYNKHYTIQTARSTEGEEINTILKHKNYFQELYNG